MFHRFLLIALLFPAGALVSASTEPKNSAIYGNIHDTKGRPLSGAEIRIDRQDAKSDTIKATTNGSGRYAANPIPVGTYRVSVALDNVVLFSADKIKTRKGDGTKVDFDLKRKSFTLTMGKSTKRFVWVEATAGSNFGGRWVEADQSGAAAPSMYNGDTMAAESVRDIQRRQVNGQLHQ